MVVVAFDNGGSTIKAGILGHPTAVDPRIVVNAVIRSKGDKATYVGHELDKCKDYSSLNYRLPVEKGYVVDWDAQKAIWDGVLSDEVLNVNPTESTLLMTEPYFNLPKIQQVYDQFIFEEYEFQAHFRSSPASLIPHGSLFGLPPPECMIIVDSGFSFTHVVPVMEGKVVWSAVKRLDVGGKLLTNQLKELVSFRQWNMMEETFIMNHVKETCCFVSQDFKKDIEICRENVKTNSIVQEYVLPDLTKSKAGRVRQPDDIALDTDQVLTMGNERFAVPEIIFRPDDIGLEQCGLAQAISASISLLPHDLQGMFWANIGLIGGNTKLTGFRDRLLSELQSLAPFGCDVVLYQSSDPTLDAYHSAIALASLPTFTSSVAVTRAEYLEYGSLAMRRKCPDWQPAPPPLREREPTTRDRDHGKESGRDRAPSGKDKKQDGTSLKRQESKGKGKAKAEQVETAPEPSRRTRVRAINPVGASSSGKRG
ncbi:actin-related protein Arp6 [Favolaschia claudopus]|uniref:Actin-like protein ARP6 n=1 Tax=Favolaschia claudopus TaxID=2862362 RepID=A0AAW0D832_9AGAR